MGKRAGRRSEMGLGRGRLIQRTPLALSDRQSLGWIFARQPTDEPRGWGKLYELPAAARCQCRGGDGGGLACPIERWSQFVSRLHPALRPAFVR